MPIQAEKLLYELSRVIGRPTLIKKALASDLAWRASGATFATAVIATTGSLRSRADYLSVMAARMGVFASLFNGSIRVLEFGSGLGGNLLAVAPRIREGHGLDVNPWYCQLADDLRRKLQVGNVAFHCYDGATLPSLGSFDVVIAFGPFERVARGGTTRYLGALSTQLVEGGRLIAHFLTESSRSKGFTRLLGDEAYTIWGEQEIIGLLASRGLVLESWTTDFPSAGITLVTRKVGSR